MDESNRRRARRTQRLEIHATVVAGDTTTEELVATNVSPSGILLAGHLEVTTGQDVVVLIRIPDGTTLTVRGVVARVGRDPDELAIRFRQVGRALKRLENLVREMLEDVAMRGVLIVDEDVGRCDALISDAAHLGLEASRGGSLLEIVEQLQTRNVQRVVVDLRHAAARAVLEFLADGHPQVRRVVMARPVDQSGAEAETTAGRAHAFLLVPWDMASLTRALDAPSV